MLRANVSELKSHLSSYLNDVRGGETIVVCDRNTPIARLSPYDEGHGLVIKESTRKVADLRKIRGVAVDTADAVELLRQARDQR